MASWMPAAPDSAAFAGVQHRISDSLTVEVNALGSYGRKLITTDIVNRDFSTLAGRYNGALEHLERNNVSCKGWFPEREKSQSGG